MYYICKCSTHKFNFTGSNGVLAFWDLRGQQDYPLSVVKAHSDAVSEVHFHDHQPDHMFTCSQSGDGEYNEKWGK